MGNEDGEQPPQYTEKDKARARQWFRKAHDCRERREYDYAIECFITGLSFWPEAVEEGHKPLRALGIGRQQAGGKKPGMMEGLKKPMTGKDAKQCLLNAEHLMAKDPANGSYLDGVLKNAARSGFHETVRWVAPLVLDSLRKDKKPNMGRFKAFRQALVESAEKADAQGLSLLVTSFYEQALHAVEYLIARNPTEMSLRDEQRDLSGRLTIAKGKYAEADSFRESIQDAEAQKLLHDAGRIKQSERTLEGLIEAARRELAQHPDVPAKINALVDALLKTERATDEAEAIDILTKAYERSQNYSFKVRADDIRLRKLRRQTRRCAEKVKQGGTAEDKQQQRLAAMEELQSQLEIFRERCEQYPTDLRLKYHLGRALFKARQYDQAIPALQGAQGEPRNRIACQLLIGRSFFEKGTYTQAREVLTEALEHCQHPDDTSKEITYWLGRACEAEGNAEQAKSAYGKLLRQDYNYADGDARKRLEALK